MTTDVDLSTLNLAAFLAAIQSQIHASDDNELLTESQASKVIGAKPNTLANWRCTGRYDLPYLKVGRLVRYTRGDCLTFLAARRSAQAGKP